MTTLHTPRLTLRPLRPEDTDPLVAMFADPELGLDYSRVVHGEQRFVAARPIRAGDRLTVTVTVENIRAAAGNDMLTTRGDVSTVDGEHVCMARSTLVERGA